MSGDSRNVTTTTRAEPLPGAQPGIAKAFSAAENLFDSPFPQYFPFQAVTPFSTETEESLRGRAALARQESPLVQGAGGLLGQTLRGDFLRPESNPFLDATYDLAARRVRPQVESVFQRGGRTGSGAHAETLGRVLGDLATDIYGGNYQQERGRQMQGMMFAPALNEARFSDVGQLAQVGQQREALGQAQLQDAINRFNFEQNQPQTKLENFMRILTGAPGGVQSTSQPVFRNQGAGLVGGGLSGALLGREFGLKGNNLLIPALLGGLLGGFA